MLSLHAAKEFCLPCKLIVASSVGDGCPRPGRYCINLLSLDHSLFVRVRRWASFSLLKQGMGAWPPCDRHGTFLQKSTRLRLSQAMSSSSAAETIACMPCNCRNSRGHQQLRTQRDLELGVSPSHDLQDFRHIPLSLPFRRVVAMSNLACEYSSLGFIAYSVCSKV